MDNGDTLVLILTHAEEAQAKMLRLRAGLNTIVRAWNPTGECLPTCSSWSEDYRVNDCDCGYDDACDNVAEFAAAVLADEVNLDAHFREVNDGK